MPQLDASKTISGNFGEIWSEGVWLSNFYSAEASGDVTYEKIKRAGTRKVGNKASTIEYSGSIRGYKITSELTKKVAQINKDTAKPFVTELIFKLNDPESFGSEYVRLKGVQFTKIDISKFEHGAIVEQEWNFVFDDFEFLSEISG